MWARLSRFAGLPPEHIDATLEQFQEQQLSNIEEQQGFQGILVGVDRGEGKALAISLWDNLEDLRESDRAADQAREQAVETAGPRREPVVDRYEVILERFPHTVSS